MFGSNSDLFKISTPTPTFPKFPTPTPTHKVNEVWLPRILLQLTRSGNCGTQQEFAVSTKVS